MGAEFNCSTSEEQDRKELLGSSILHWRQENSDFIVLINSLNEMTVIDVRIKPGGSLAEKGRQICNLLENFNGNIEFF